MQIKADQLRNDLRKRQFPVFGAVSGMIASLGAMEAIKLVAGLGQPLTNRLLLCDLRDVTFRTVKIDRDPNCPCCGRVDRHCRDESHPAQG